MENTSAVSGRRDMFLDERGTGLRVTWHPERDLVVLSVWQGDRCIGTFRMSVQDIPRLSGLLAAALNDWVDQSGGPADPSGQKPGGPGSTGLGGTGLRGSGAGSFRSDRNSRITGEWEVGDPESGSAVASGGPGAGRGAEARMGSADAVGSATEEPTAADSGLSMQQRIRLSRTVLRFRGIQHRRRWSR